MNRIRFRRIILFVFFNLASYQQSNEKEASENTELANPCTTA